MSDARRLREGFLNLQKKLVESPKEIGAGFIYPDEATSLYKTLSRDKRTKVLSHPYKDADLVESGQKFAVLDHSLKMVTYYMVFSERQIKGHKVLYQSILWRNKSVEGTKDIPIHVFWNHLFPKTGMVCTDKIQTDLGKGFWNNLIVDSIVRMNLHAYFIDLNKNETKEISSERELSDIAADIWGKTEANKARLVMISKSTLPVSESIDSFGIPMFRL